MLVPVTIRTRTESQPPCTTQGEAPYADCPLAVTNAVVFDHVVWGHKQLVGEIVAISDGDAWVRVLAGGNTVQPLTSLERAS